MMDGRDHFHYIDLRSPEDGVVGGLDVKDIELYEDDEQICVDWELDRAKGTGFTPVETVEK